MYCIFCEKKLLEGDINYKKNYAKCSNCRAIFKINKSLEYREEDLSIPPNIEIEEKGRNLKIKVKWYSSGNVFFLFLSLFVASLFFIWFIVPVFIALGLAELNKGEILMIGLSCGGILHIAFSFILVYISLAGVVNYSLVYINDGKITICHRPLPWSKSKIIPSSEIIQLYCKEYITRGRHSKYILYKLIVITKDRKENILLSMMAGTSEILFIEETIENLLDIPDRPVPGEIRKN